MSSLYDNLFKIILIGDWGVGKSNIILRITQDAFDSDSRTTIGVEFSQKVLTMHNKKIVVQIWDTAGQDRYKAITSAYYRAAVGAILVYDITKRSSFENLKNWVRELQENTNHSTSVLILANKIDLESARCVSVNEGKDFAKQHGYLFEEVSALTGQNVQKAFTEIVETVFKVTMSEAYEIKRPGSKLSFVDEHQQVGYCRRFKDGYCCS